MILLRQRVRKRLLHVLRQIGRSLPVGSRVQGRYRFRDGLNPAFTLFVFSAKLPPELRPLSQQCR